MSLIKVAVALVLGIYIANTNPALADQIYTTAMNFVNEAIVFVKGLQK
jgi:hypothetical protein